MKSSPVPRASIKLWTPGGSFFACKQHPPSPDEPPFFPQDNLTGIYAKEFSVAADWERRRVVIHFGGAESVLYVYVNGQAAGLSKDSRLP